MGAQLLHTKLINQAAREVLSPLGIIQKGRSRLWLDDHGWWLALIGFQPSSWSRGTYLNVGVHWLWYGVSYFSYDLGNRVEEFTPFQTESQFEQESHRIVDHAVTEVMRYRRLCQSIHAIAKVLAKKSNLGGWHLYHAGIACGLAGRMHDAQGFLRKLIAEESVIQTDEGSIVNDWHIQLRERASNLLTSLSTSDVFQAKINEIIINSREVLGLKQWSQFVYEKNS
jgi:hypothetical protein